jgi:hypothetical protein
VFRSDNLTTFMCRLSINLGASNSWNPKGLSRSVMGLLYLYIYTFYISLTAPLLCYAKKLVRRSGEGIKGKIRPPTYPSAYCTDFQTQPNYPYSQQTVPFLYNYKTSTNLYTSKQTIPVLIKDGTCLFYHRNFFSSQI